MPWSAPQRLDLALLEVRVDLDLVDRGHDGRLLEQAVEVLDHEVADADGADLALLEQRLQGPVRLQGLVEGRGQRLVQDEQVDLVDAELAGALVEPVQSFVVAVVADPDLRLDEHLVPIESGGVDGLTDLALVAVGGSGVDVPVAGAQRRLDRGAGLLRRGLEHPEPEGGHLHAVVQLQLVHEFLSMLHFWVLFAWVGSNVCRSDDVVGGPVIPPLGASVRSAGRAVSCGPASRRPRRDRPRGPSRPGRRGPRRCWRRGRPGCTPARWCPGRSRRR